MAAHDHAVPDHTPAAPMCEVPAPSPAPSLTEATPITPDGATDVAAAYGNQFLLDQVGKQPDAVGAVGTTAATAGAGFSLRTLAHPDPFPRAQRAVSGGKPRGPATPRFGAPPDLPGGGRVVGGGVATALDVGITLGRVDDHVDALAAAEDTDGRVSASSQLLLDAATVLGVWFPAASAFAGMGGLAKAGDARPGGRTASDEVADQADNARRAVAEATWPWLGEVAGAATFGLSTLAEGGESLLRGAGRTVSDLLGYLVTPVPGERSPAKERASRCLSSCHGARPAAGPPPAPARSGHADPGGPALARPSEADVARIVDWLSSQP